MNDDVRVEIQERDRVGHVQVKHSALDDEADRLGHAEWRNNLQVQQRKIIRDANHIRQSQT